MLPYQFPDAIASGFPTGRAVLMTAVAETGAVPDPLRCRRVCVVDDDPAMREAVCAMLDGAGFGVRTYPGARHFLSDQLAESGCLIADIGLPQMGGLELLRELTARGIDLPVIFLSDRADVSLAVCAMKAGAVDFILKPVEARSMIASVEDALRIGRWARKRATEMRTARDTLALLTPRERHVMEQLVKGHSNKVAAHKLGISARTVEFHRAHIMSKLNARSMSDLVRVALTLEQVSGVGFGIGPMPGRAGLYTAFHAAGRD